MTAANVKQQMGAEEVIEKTGVRPEQIVGWLALMGDQSDNIRGVPGVGSKTATRLLNEYGSLEGIWDGLNDVHPERIRKALSDSRKAVDRNVELVRLADDLDCPIKWETMEVHPESPGGVLPFLNRLELHSLAKEIEEPELF